MKSLRFIIIPVIILGLGYLIYSQIKQPTAKAKKPPGIRKVPKIKVIELQVENYTSSIESNGIKLQKLFKVPPATIFSGHGILVSFAHHDELK